MRGLPWVALLSVASCVADRAPEVKRPPAVPSPSAATVRAEPARGPHRVVDAAAGSSHVCAMSDRGEVFCWGRNDERQLGDGSAEHRGAPARVEGLGAASRVFAGPSGTCAVLKAGTVACWGTVAARSHEQAELIPELGEVRAVAIGLAHACAVVASGAVRCWGDNAYGQLGDGTTVSHATPATAVHELHDVVEVAVIGTSGSCARRESGGVVCWGALRPKWPVAQAHKQSKQLVPRPVTGLPALRSLSATFAGPPRGIDAQGQAWSWGTSLDPASAATVIDGWSDVDQFVSLAVGPFWRCAVTASTRLVECSAFDRQTMKEGPRAAVSGLSALSERGRLVANGKTLCVLDRGSLSCAGDNEYGQLGVGELSTVTTPRAVTGVANVKSALSFAAATCALDEQGVVSCWGLGRADPTQAERDAEPWRPRAIDGLGRVTRLFEGPRAGEACAVNERQEVACFLAGHQAAPSTSASAPRRLVGLEAPLATARIVDTSVPGADVGAYAILASRKVVAFRAKEASLRKQAGGSVVDVDVKPIAGLAGVRQIALTLGRACALLEAGTVQCFAVGLPFGSPLAAHPEPSATQPALRAVANARDLVELAAAPAARGGATASFYGRRADGTVLRWELSTIGSQIVSAPEANEVPELAGASHGVGGALVRVARPLGVEELIPAVGPAAAGSSRQRRLAVSGVAALWGGANACIGHQDGRLSCWGTNRGGALAAPDRESSSVLLQVALPEE